MLSVFWDTNTIGFADETVVESGLQHYTFAFPNATSNSTHILGFRLDTFTNVQSGVVITNVALGFVGVNQPFTRSVTTNTFEGLKVLQLQGQSGFNYVVEASTNLADWSTMAILVNTNGIVRFVDQASTNAPARFYRAVAP